MALRFTLSTEHTARFFDVLTCLSKFSDLVSIEARYDKLVLSALNLSKSAFACFTLEKNEFFTQYEYDTLRQEDRFSCCVLNRALASVFRGRLGDSKTGEGAIERCEVIVDDRPHGEECRLVIKLIYRLGMTKTFKLTYEAAEMMQAVFDKGRASNTWKASARMLRELTEHFGPKTEQLDMCSDEGQVTMMAYTEKVTNGKETLKQPLQTSVTIDTSDFDQFDVQDGLHIAISVKDYRSTVAHASTLAASVSAHYSNPSQPLQFSYSKEGMQCEFTLMTLGEQRGSTPGVTRAATRQPSVQQSERRSEPKRSVRPEMPPPAPSQPRRDGKLGSRTTVPPRESAPTFDGANEQSLFVPEADDDDQRWDPPEEQDQDTVMLGWDPSAGEDSGFRATFMNNSTRPPEQQGNGSGAQSAGIMPTQRASQVKGLFDFD